MLLFKIYQLLTLLLSPFLKGWVRWRALRGKEDKERLDERWGFPSLGKRPQGPLYWLHAVSVGEANSSLILIKLLRELSPQGHILMTTGTRTSAELMAETLPPGVTHQYYPLDTPFSVKCFLDFWQPQLAIWVESEIWPNMLYEIKRRQIPALLMNGRMSQRSFAFWKRLKPFIQPLIQTFTWCGAQSPEDQETFRTLGAQSVDVMPNLKWLADAPSYSEEDYQSLQKSVSGRFVWFASCTHAGEEKRLLLVHKRLRKKHKEALLFLAPRHTHRREVLIAELERQGLPYAVRSAQASPHPKNAVYLIDSMGELSLFYKLSPKTSMGGTWVPLGGHNPMEAAQMGSYVFHGKYVKSNHTLYALLDKLGLSRQVEGEEELLSVLEGGVITTRQKWSQLKQQGREELKAILAPFVSNAREEAC